MWSWEKMIDSSHGSNISRTRFFTSKITKYIVMESCDFDSMQEMCWFCKKGRHKECMKEIPVNNKSDGPHDCTFDTKLIPCKCTHK